MVNEIRIDDKELIVMNLVHYFVTEQNYNPVVVHGINDEVWLENMTGDYKIIRIVSRYIHNDEQLGFNRFRSRQIAKKLRMKTLSFKMNILSIYVNLGENVKSLEDEGNNMSVFIKNLQDFENNPTLIQVFPDIIEKTNHSEEGIELLFKITDDINHTNEKKNAKLDKIFSSKKPIVTYIIMGICTAMFIVSGFGMNAQWGANYGPLVREGEIYRLISCMFLHSGFIHFGLNMYSLYIIGPKVEDFFGKWKFFLIYMLGGLAGSLLSIGLGGNLLSVGASGAIFSLFGALIYFGYTYRGYIGSIVESQVVPVVFCNLLLGIFIPGIGMWCHIGGLIGGLIISNILGTIENKKYMLTNILMGIIYYGFLGYLVFLK